MVSIVGYPIGPDDYTTCFYAALASAGVRVEPGIFSGRWMLKHLRDVDYVHINWPSFLYDAPTLRGSLHNFAVFLFMLALMRLRGIRLIWTVHNLRPHRPSRIKAFDPIARWLIVKLGTRFLVHGPSAEAEVLRHYPAMAGRTLVIDHGHWRGFHPNTIDRQDARAKLELSDNEFVFLFVGLCAPYKNLHGLIAAFERLETPSKLLIVGQFRDRAYEGKIRAAAAQAGPRVRLGGKFVPDEELQIYLNACDVVVVPYAEVLTSGTAMLALSFGRPVIAPAMGFLNDVIAPDCGSLYDPAKSEGLIEAMRGAPHARFDEQRIVAEALQHDWMRSAEHLKAELAAALTAR